MSNYDYRPGLDHFMTQERAPEPAPASRPPKTHLDSDAYWHTSARHDGRGPDWDEAPPDQTRQETNTAACAVIATR